MRVCNHVNDPCIESVKFPSQHCISEYFTDEHIQARTYHGLVLALLMQLFTYSATILVNTVLLVVYQNSSRFSCLAERVDLQRHDLSACKNTTGKIKLP